MKKVEQAEEELVPGAHHEQNGLRETGALRPRRLNATAVLLWRSHLGGVVDPQDGVPRQVDALMARRAFDGGAGDHSRGHVTAGRTRGGCGEAPPSHLCRCSQWLATSRHMLSWNRKA